MSSSKPKVAIVGSSSALKDYPEQLTRLQSFSEVQRFSIPDSPEPDNMTAIARVEAPEDIIKKLKDYDGMILSVDPFISAEVLSELDKLQVIARHGIGYNNVDFMKALELGIPVTKVQGWVEQASVAELAVTLAGAIARKVAPGSIALNQGKWEDRKGFHGPEVAGRTVGIIGYGNIGSGAAKIFRTIAELAPGGEVLVCDPYKQDEIKAAGFKSASLEEVCTNSDFISIHCFANEETKYILNENLFKLMKPGTIIVNTARGILVNAEELLPYLDEGTLLYASDVFEVEPLPVDSRLINHQNTLIVPHIGGYGTSSKIGMGDACVGAMEMVLRDGKVPDNVINSLGQGVGELVPEHAEVYQEKQEKKVATYRIEQQ